MAASLDSFKLTSKQRHLLVRIARRNEKWNEGHGVKDAVVFGRLRVKLKACLRRDGRGFRVADVSLVGRSKDALHKKVLAGPVGEFLRSATADPQLAGIFFPRLAKLWAKGVRQMDNATRRLVKLATKLNVGPEKLLELAVEAAKAGKHKAKKAKKAKIATKSQPADKGAVTNDKAKADSATAVRQEGFSSAGAAGV